MNVDINEYIPSDIENICKKEEVNPSTFSRASPFKKIWGEYIKFLGSFFNERQRNIFEDNGNKGMKKDELRFKEMFTNFVKDIKKRYPKKMWEVK